MDLSNIKLSIIIVSYNSGEILRDCLESVRRFFPEDDVIIVDNHPENFDTNIYQAEFPEFRFISNPQNNGFGAGNNLGVDNSTGEILFFLNPDTVIEEFDRERLIRHHRDHKYLICGFPLYFPDGKFCKPLKFIPEIDFILPKKLYDPLYKLIFKKDRRISKLLYISGAAFTIMKKDFIDAGLFDKNFFLFFEENDLRSSLLKVKKYNPHILSNGFRIIHHEGKSYNRNAISWYSDSLKLYCDKTNKQYLMRYKRMTTGLSLMIGNLRGKDGESKRILINELKKR